MKAYQYSRYLRQRRTIVLQVILLICSGLILIAYHDKSNKMQAIITAQYDYISELEYRIEHAELSAAREPEPIRSVITRGLPRESTGEFKSYMSYKAITTKGSGQWKLQQEAWTDEQGYRRHGENYMVAMGTYYADKVGRKFIISLSSGQVVPVIVGDIKADQHTDELNQYRTTDKSIIEFIVDTDRISAESKRMGTMVEWRGQITGIAEVVE